MIKLYTDSNADTTRTSFACPKCGHISVVFGNATTGNCIKCFNELFDAAVLVNRFSAAGLNHRIKYYKSEDVS
jgi:hypothetical protein